MFCPILTKDRNKFFRCSHLISELNNEICSGESIIMMYGCVVEAGYRIFHVLIIFVEVLY